MRLRWWKCEKEAMGKPRATDATDAILKAETLLDSVRAKSDEVSDLSRRMRLVRTENHLAERIAETFGRYR